MKEQTQQSGSQQQTVADKLEYRSRTKPRNPNIDYYGNKGLVLPYEKYQKYLSLQIQDNEDFNANEAYQCVKRQVSKMRNSLLAQSMQQFYAPLMDLIGKNKNIQFKKMWSNSLSFDEWSKNKKDTDKIKCTEWKGVEEDVNGDNFPEFVDHDHNRFIWSADGLRITVPFKRQRVTKYLTENPSSEDRATSHYKSWKEEEKHADGYGHFIKHYLSPFLKERGYTVAQIYSVIGGRIRKGVTAPWVLQYYDKSYQAQSFIGDNPTSLAIYQKLSKASKQVQNQYFINGQSQQRDNQMMRLIQIDYAVFWNRKLGDIPDSTNDDGEEIFVIPTELALKQSKYRRDEKRLKEQKSYESDMAKIKARKARKFYERMTLESARLARYDFQNDLDDYVIEDQ
ncbi:MAG: hypothetical protein EZS28_008186 [Streblomastix strix]|uniref:Uncharacterized protein n=1 Tax=Streblomastix strix TaxID=222440 RepID=A0A5J4WNX6_9EUKA|nr:MAG: hypothetical protein EZS28_008186 [Streblomastix strix]